MEFDRQTANGFAARGAVRELMEYLSQIPDCRELYDRYVAIYEREEYIESGLPEKLDYVLRCFQKYYRDCFYLQNPRQDCELRLYEGLKALFPDASPDLSLWDLTDTLIPALFQSENCCFENVYNDGYHSAAVWGSTESKTYEVELPDGAQTYTLRFLNDRLITGWSEYLSFGDFVTGGWVGSDGIINCFWETYDLDSEDFNISLLKHEAQHVYDLSHWPDMSNLGLEYRAYLVELIYCTERNRLLAYAQMADPDQPHNEHTTAYHLLATHFAQRLGTDDFASVPIPEIQALARELFQQSTEEVIEAFKPNA